MHTEFKTQLQALNNKDKALMLSRLVHYLTISARSAYGERKGEEKLRSVNEMMHIIAGKLLGVLEQTSQQYPDDVFIDILFEAAGEHESDLRWAWNSALRLSRV